jgi:hypothetical protein
MKAILPIFAGLVALGAGVAAEAQLPAQGTPTAAPPAAPSGASAPDSISGDALLRRVLTAVDDQPAIGAKVRYLVNLKGHAAVGSGIYLQQGRGAGRMLRFELTLELAGVTSTVRQVSDGSVLWIHEDLAGQQKLAQVDLVRLRQARPKPESSPSPDGLLAMGGLPKLLAGLDGAFRFGAVSESRLDELRVWTLRGTWEPARLARLLPDQKAIIEKGGQADLSKLSPQLPDTVVLHVGCDDFFPYRIEYLRSVAGDKSAPLVARPNVLLVLELYEVHTGGAVDPANFAFQSGTLKPVDRTVEFLDRLGLEEITTGALRRSPPRR